MRKSLIISFVVALAMAGGTVYVVNTVLSAGRGQGKIVEPKAKSKPKLTYVLVAIRSLQPGQFLRPSDLRWQVWPASQVSRLYSSRKGPLTNHTNKRIRDLSGAVVRLPVPGGQPITDEMIVFPGERGFLAAVLKPGMRAVSIKINAATGVSGLAFPGDRVDLIWVYKLAKKRGVSNNAGTKVAETLLVRVRLLAINQNLGHAKVDRQSQGKSSKVRVPKFKRVRKLSTVTVELTPKQAEIIAVALSKGRITLSLNSLARPTSRQNNLLTAAHTDQTLASDPDDGTPKRGRTFTVDQHISRLLTYRRRNQPIYTNVIVLRGGKAENVRVIKSRNRVPNPNRRGPDDSVAQVGDNR